MITLFRLLSRLPLSWLQALGALLGWLTWLASPTYRRHMRENMVLALGEAEARRLRPAAIAEAGKAALELTRIWLRPLAEAAARVVQVSGWELVEQATREGRGILYLTPHLGCFEITAQYLSTRAPITVLYRPPRQPWLQAMIEAGRARDQLFLAAAQAGVGEQVPVIFTEVILLQQSKCERKTVGGITVSTGGMERAQLQPKQVRVVTDDGEG